MDENNFGVPAGWYPDPLGLPQLRWWDSQAWTEHTSEARAPIIIQPASTSTRLGFADEEIGRWLAEAGLDASASIALPPDTAGLTVTIWTATRPAAAKRSVA